MNAVTAAFVLRVPRAAVPGDISASSRQEVGGESAEKIFASGPAPREGTAPLARHGIEHDVDPHETRLGFGSVHKLWEAYTQGGKEHIVVMNAAATALLEL